MLNKRALLVYAVLIWHAISAAAQTASTPPARQLFDLLNQEREKAGLKQYAWDDRLAGAALVHAKLLAEHRELSHQFPQEPSVLERLRATGVRFTASAENVANAGSVEEAHQALMTSPGHRANIMSTDYNSVGIAIAEASGHLYVTEDFAWVMPTYTEQQFRDAFTEAFNRARKDKGLAPLDVKADMTLHAVACSTGGDVRAGVAGLPGETAAVLFTSSEPGKLPDQLGKYFESVRLRRMKVGVCFRPDPRYGYANFWVALSFGGEP